MNRQTFNFGTKMKAPNSTPRYTPYKTIPTINKDTKDIISIRSSFSARRPKL
jgi:hypothetical protein